ncbi:hypothetical protein D3C72_1091510 [compost metagenome]
MVTRDHYTFSIVAEIDHGFLTSTIEVVSQDVSTFRRIDRNLSTNRCISSIIPEQVSKDQTSLCVFNRASRVTTKGNCAFHVPVKPVMRNHRLFTTECVDTVAHVVSNEALRYCVRTRYLVQLDTVHSVLGDSTGQQTDHVCLTNTYQTSTSVTCDESTDQFNRVTRTFSCRATYLNTVFTVVHDLQFIQVCNTSFSACVIVPT